ncbi:hypothetical protein H6G00_05790 [Leptolyngbya sp. FACHB-541]|uniref:hypothetical protein n=1 Tax=Leptolyngbya sp. FACHB-541 TaxID=2692810 RepID=UPI0016863127|nr:hypothetical protein [Leptolyngbya sp. FACHB-541]MBD1996129.1 hypothetical protein [Leptolyngbya sp. FACHB-541]
MVKKKEFRGYITQDLDRLIRALAAIKNGDRDWSISDVLQDALETWAKLPENQELIKKHNLNNLD